jgi:NAD(P)-dependent dehydrogenase (short-subunit alcohol dehydrogenase family)
MSTDPTEELAMKNFADKTAVITGGAGGIGRGLANLAADRQMNVVLADVQEDALAAAVAELESRQCPVLGVQTDIRHREAIEKLYAEATGKFGNVHLLFNNAGVVSGGPPVPIWEVPDVDWNWVHAVNFNGVLYGVQTFVPHMIGHGEEGHIVNTSSIGCFLPGSGPYGVSKYGVVILSEQLAFDLQAAESKIGASLLVPGWVNTGIGNAERNRPSELRNELNPEGVGVGLEEALTGGKSPEDLAAAVFESIENDRFYIFPHSGWDYVLRDHTAAMLDRGDPYRFDFLAHLASRAEGKDV